VTDPGRAVFLSYASADVDAAQRLCDALMAAGIEVWFDRGELRGGEAWDASIRRQIRACQLFVAVISATTETREEGYFRREWNLAVERTLDMAHDKAFLLPVVIDGTSEDVARVPEKFRAVQWTHLPRGKATSAFVERVALLLGQSVSPPAAPPPAAAPQPAATVSVPPSMAVPRLPTAHVAASGTTRAERAGRGRAFRAVAIGVPLLALIGAAAYLIPLWQKREHARTVLLPAVVAEGERITWSSRDLLDRALEVEKYLPHDPMLARVWPTIASDLVVESQPVGAEVWWKDYDTPAEAWRRAGFTPLKDAKVPNAPLRIEVRKKGFQTVEILYPRPDTGDLPVTPRVKLDPDGSLPPRMARIPASVTDMKLVGLHGRAGTAVPEFLADRFEVTNREFKAFVDAGGYTNPDFWREPIIDGSRELPLSAALARFKDRTGRPGPSTWEAGTYPDGTGDHPVTGVSWYEAAAYARFVHKELPTVFHFAQLADTNRLEFLVRVSNLRGKGTVPVGSLPGLSSYGVYDIAGNAREWIANATADPAQRYILGGGWNDPPYAFNDSYWQPALDRSPTNGFRCIRGLAPSDAARAELRRPLIAEVRDYAKETPVDDKTFVAFLRQFSYDKAPLAPKVEKTLATLNWRLEVVSINAAYNGERMQVYVFLPLAVTRPLQAVVYFPGSDAQATSHFDAHSEVDNFLDFIVKGGRAVVYPVFKGTFERAESGLSTMPEESVAYRDHVVMWAKDLRRAIDYLETRKDIAADKIAYLGYSWGGFLGPIMAAAEPRIRVVLLNVAGLTTARPMPEADAINYLPRVTQPVLMLDGEYDMYFPVETSQKPMFRLLGTAAKDKRMIVYPHGHVVPQLEFMRETLAWLDKYLGPP
jgi:eukaryotic-like serine/threonine-protein kinase